MKDALGPIVRRVPIDFRDIARQSGCTRGRLCKTVFGWGVQDGNGGADFAIVNPPPMQPGETSLRIEDNHWCFCTPTDQYAGDCTTCGGPVVVPLYRFCWGNNPKRATMRGRVCRVICRGKMNSAEIEFLDNGQREVVSRNALRRYAK